MVRFVGCLIIAFWLLSPGFAAAKRVEDESIAQARELYRQATASYKLGEFQPALEKYKEAYRARPDPAFLFNIAQCYRQLGRPEEAAREYRAYLRDAPNAANRADVESLIAEMDRAVAARTKPPVSVQPPPESVRPEAVPPVAPPPAKSRAWIGWTVGAGVLVLAGLGVALGVGLSQGSAAPDSTLGTFGVKF